MSTFGTTLFGGSRFVRWSLTPVILFFALWMPTMTHNMTAHGIPALIGMEILFAAMLGGFWLPENIGRWCFRFVTGVVFVIYLVAVIDAFTSAKHAPTGGDVSQQSPYTLLWGFIIIGLPSLWYTLTGRFSLRSEVSQEELSAANDARRQAFEAILLRPDWSFYERHLRRPAPAALRALYADENLITSTLLDYSDSCSINTFEPLNEESLFASAEDAEQSMIPIATTDSGDPIYLKSGLMESNAVYVAYHDGDDVEVLADSVSAFVHRLKQANKAIA